METNIMKVKQKVTYTDGAPYNKIYFTVFKEELKLECEVFQTCINDKFTDYNDLVLEAPRICAKCDQIFPNSFTYLQHNLSHIQVKVPKVQWIFCHRCPEKFLTTPALEKHIKESHLKLKPHENKLKQCDICNKIFSKKYWYAHKAVHKGNQILTCHKCKTGKVFKTKVTLKRHLRNVHGNVKEIKKEKNIANDFKCNECPKVFQSKDCLQHHVKNCHVIMEVRCDLCGAVFKNKPYLLIHINRVHYDDGHLYPCDICGKTFKAPRRVKIHKKNSHKFISKLKFERGSKIKVSSPEL